MEIYIKPINNKSTEVIQIVGLFWKRENNEA